MGPAGSSANLAKGVLEAVNSARTVLVVASLAREDSARWVAANSVRVDSGRWVEAS